MRWSGRRRVTALTVLVVAALAGCTAGTGPQPTGSPTGAAPTSPPVPSAAPFRATAPAGPALVLDMADPVRAAVAASRTLFVEAPVVVLAPVDDSAAQLTAASAAVALGAPVLLTAPAAGAPAASPPSTSSAPTAPSASSAPAAPVPSAGATGAPGGVDPGVAAEVARLGTTAVLVVGAAAAPPGPVVVRVAAGADAATLARALGAGPGHGPSLAAGAPVAAGGAAAAVIGLARPGTAVLRAAGATAGSAPAATGAPPAAPGTTSPTAAVAGTAATAPTTAASSDGPAAGLRLTSPGSSASGLPLTAPPTAPPGTVALVGAGPVPLAVLATVRAAGLPVVDVPAADPRATSSAVQALAHAKPSHVVALGGGFGPADRLAERVAAAATGVELPGGGQLYFPQDEGLPGKRYVALYGSPGMPALGVLGEQDVPATIARAQAHAALYRALTPDTVVAGVEIIATIASAGAGADGNYSTERPVADLLPLVQAAGAAGMTVVLDLQPGRTDFLTQAKEYESLLELPYVSLALDPEWRLGPTQVHLKQIGHVDVDEVNAVAAWLARLVADHHLPQKALVLHEFALSMITGRDRLDTSHDELAVVIHVDGQGSQPAKVGTWNAIRQGAPAGVHWGWKNFYDEDTPAMLDPAGTYAIRPTPDLVTYQ